MGIGSTFKKIRDQYVIDQAHRVRLPEFSEAPVCRRRIVFHGRVQHVGFRLEVQELANRLGLTGFCENLENGDVLAELQGTEARIQFLLDFMDSLVRIRIKHKTVEPCPIDPEETSFLRR